MKPDARIIELCQRLTSAGSIHQKLSASELHEVADFIFGPEESPETINIEVAFKLGGKFFVLKDNKVHEHQVDGLRIEQSVQPGDNYSSSIHTDISYLTWGQESFKANQMFKTREDLYKSL